MGGLGTFGEPNVTVNFNNQVANPDEVVNAINTYVKNNGSLGRVINL